LAQIASRALVFSSAVCAARLPAVMPSSPIAVLKIAIRILQNPLLRRDEHTNL
jgi:hypothetical protein